MAHLPNRSSPPALGWAAAQIGGQAVLACALAGQAPRFIKVAQPLK